MSEHDETLADNWAQFLHETHTTMRYSLRDLANGDTGYLDPADCPICTPPAPQQPARSRPRRAHADYPEQHRP